MKLTQEQEFENRLELHENYMLRYALIAAFKKLFGKRYRKYLFPFIHLPYTEIAARTLSLIIERDPGTPWRNKICFEPSRVSRYLRTLEKYGYVKSRVIMNRNLIAGYGKIRLYKKNENWKTQGREMVGNELR